VHVDAEAAWVRADPTRFEQVINNLVVNAVKYTPATGRVWVRWSADDAGGHLEIEDTGIGIEKKHLDRLTERFYRVDAGRSRREGGTGLGLAIAKHVLDRHEARLEIESQPGHGSRFCCHFPPSRLAAQVIEPAGKSDDAIGGRRQAAEQ
jgi:two-component system phosphate regulon sensor histidine kinase PhoR